MGTRFDIHRGTIDLLEGVLHTADEVISLTANEVALLGLLHDASPEPCSARRLLTEGLGYAEQARSRTVTVTIQRLRKKIEPDPAAPLTVVTVRGEGYALRYPERAAPRPVRSEVPIPEGRHADLEAVVDAFERGACPVVLVGPGGAGKTTLARCWSERNEAVWIELFGVDTPGALRRRLVAALDIEKGSDGVDAALSERLARGAVVLDNAEDLDAHARALLRGLLEPARTSGAQVLSTSQGPLGLPGEQRILLGELDPDAARAVVQDIRSRSGLEPLDSAILESLLSGLGGHPLALVVAAPLFDLLGEAEAMLDVPAEDTAVHHPTVSKALDRTLLDLDADVLDVARAIAVFPGRVTLHAVAGVADQPLPQALRSIAALRARGLARSGGGEVELVPIVRTLLRHRAPEVMEATGQRLVCWLCGLVPSIEVTKPLRPTIEHALSLASGRERLRLLSHHIELLYAFGPVDDIVPEAIRWTADLPAAHFAAAEVQRGRALLLAGERGRGADRIRHALDEVDDPGTLVQGASLVAMTLSWGRDPDAVLLAERVMEVLNAPDADERVLLHQRVEGLTYAGYALARMGRQEGLDAIERAIGLAADTLPARALTAALSKARLRGSPPEELVRCRRLLERAGSTLGRVQRAVDTADLAVILLDAHQVDEAWDLLAKPRAEMHTGHRRMLSTILTNVAIRLLDHPDRALEVIDEVGPPTRPVQIDFVRAVARRDRAALEALDDPDLVALGRAFLDGETIPDSVAWGETTKGLRTVQERMPR